VIRIDHDLELIGGGAHVAAREASFRMLSGWGSNARMKTRVAVVVATFASVASAGRRLPSAELSNCVMAGATRHLVVVPASITTGFRRTAVARVAVDGGVRRRRRKATWQFAAESRAGLQPA